MPTPEARAAFAESQQLSAQMGKIHAEELRLHGLLNATQDQEKHEALNMELTRLRGEWLKLSEEYTQVIKVFTAEVERARQNRPL